MRRFLLNIHRVLGTLLGILFLMWFVSGIVMMYHSYPSASTRESLLRAERADTAGLSFEALQERLAGSGELLGLSLCRRAGTNWLEVETDRDGFLMDAADGRVVRRLSAGQLEQVAARWSRTEATPVLRDTLHEIDVWLVGVQPFREFPVYHYDLPGGAGEELYLSSRTGGVLQYTTRSSRFWAWVGAIPHWLYIKQLRMHGRQPWTSVVLWVSGIGILMTLAGIYAGIRSWRMARRRDRRLTPYVKPAFRLHHLFGLFFGLFVLTWIFSGFMSLADVPQWLAPVHERHNPHEELHGSRLQPAAYRLDYRDVLRSAPVKRLTWTALGSLPLYKVETDDETYLVDASSPSSSASSVTRFLPDSLFCRRLMREVRPESDVRITLLTEYDGYYASRKRTLPLPVWRMEVDDADAGCYYLNPRDASCRYFNRNTRCRALLYKGLHCFSFPFFDRHPLLRDTLMWLLLLGGTAVSASGVWLAVKYVGRKMKKGGFR